MNDAPKLFNGQNGSIVIGQIHGASDELVRLYWDNGTVYYKNDRAGASNEEVKFAIVDTQGYIPNISLGESFSYVISVKGDHLVVAVYADGKVYSSEISINSVWQSDTLYFKAGAYLGVNETQGTGQAVVEFQALDFSHFLNDSFDGLLGDSQSSLTERTSYTGWIETSAAEVDDAINNVKGTAGNDQLYGTAGADRLNGYAGNDVLSGGAGNDFYYVDSVRNARMGTDKVFASVSYTLSDNVENLRMTGTGAFSGTGNALANSICGNDAANIIKGLGGNDKLYGAGGNDILYGGEGADRFIFDTSLGASSNVDALKDFSHAQLDRIMLSSDIFKDMGDTGKLSDTYFHLGSKAISSDDHILYDVGSGKIHYDPDGNGGTAAIHFATVQPYTLLFASDFYMF